MSAVDVLVVDDDEAIAEFVAVVLTGRGYRVTTVCDGQEAMESLENAIPHVVLLDLTLPRMNGWQLVQALRASARLRDVPVVVMSAHSDIREEAKSIGAAGYLRKPFDLDELFSCVAHHAGARG